MLRRLACPLAVLALAACTRGTRPRGWVPVAAADDSSKATARLPPPGVPLAWFEGKLPPEVDEGTPRRGGTLVVRVAAEPPSLDLITDSDLITAWMLDRKVYQSLGELDGSKPPDYPLRPVLATSWEISPDGKTFTFHIRHGVRWDDGAPFTGQDVVATVQKILDPKVRAMQLRGYFEDLADIRTLPGDDFTVVAKYKKPYFLAFRSLATLPIYPKHILDVAGDLLHHSIHRAPVGTGPFKFQSWDTANKRIVFVRSDTYWGRKAWLDRVVYRCVEDPTVAFQMLAKGEFDLFTELSSENWVSDMPRVPALVKGYHRIKFYDVNYSFIGWNEKTPFLADRRVRLAITYAMDRQGMLDHFLNGTERMTTCNFYPESSACDQTLKPRPYDLVKAAALLDQAGWKDHDGDGLRDKNGVPAHFTFLTLTSSPFFEKTTAYMQQQLEQIGVGMDIKKVQWALYLQMLRDHQFDACGLLWGNTDVQDDPFEIWHSSQAKEGANYISYSNPEADRLIEEARGTLDDAKRNALYRQFGRILYHDNPYTFLYNRPELDAVRDDVRGIRPQVPWYDLEDVWLAQPQVAATK